MLVMSNTIVGGDDYSGDCDGATAVNDVGDGGAQEITTALECVCALEFVFFGDIYIDTFKPVTMAEKNHKINCDIDLESSQNLASAHW